MWWGIVAVPAVDVSTRPGSVDDQDLVARDDDFVDGHRLATIEAFHTHTDERVLIVTVEHVTEPIGIEDGLAEEDAVLAVGDEVHDRRLRNDVGCLGRVSVCLARERDAQPARESVDHGVDDAGGQGGFGHRPFVPRL